MGIVHIRKEYLYKQFKGAILGFAVADAFGVPAEFMKRNELKSNPVYDMISGGVHNQPAGTWSDDTSMVLCTMESLIETGIDYNDQMKRFEEWLLKGINTANGEVFDVGMSTRRAIIEFAKGTAALESGDKSEYACGNGSLMRILPTALYIMSKYRSFGLDDRATEIIHNTSACTHAHPRCKIACGIYSSILFEMCLCGRFEDAVKIGIHTALKYYREKEEFKEYVSEFENLGEIDTWDESQIKSSGYVIHTLQAVVWCLLNSSGYADCVIKAVNLGEDTDTIAALVGGLAGFWYGIKEIPTDWLDATAKHDEIEALCNRFYFTCIEG